MNNENMEIYCYNCNNKIKIPKGFDLSEICCCPHCDVDINILQSLTDLRGNPSAPYKQISHGQVTQQVIINNTCPLRVYSSACAIWSFWLGLIGWFTMGVTTIPAIICGHVALSNIKKSNGGLRGENMAKWGLFFGYFPFILAILGGFMKGIMGN